MQTLKLRISLISLVLLSVFLLVSYAQETAAPAPPSLSREQMEELLRKGEIIGYQWLGKGVSNPRVLTLRDGDLEFRAVFKVVDERAKGVTTMSSGRSEMDFKDSWHFEVAAYELDNLLGLNMTPPTVERSYKGKKGSLQWWVEGAMTESERIKKEIQPPDTEEWNRTMYKIRLFDGLIYNSDRHLGNLIITPDWKVWMIDHSRAFKILNTLAAPQLLTRFSLSEIEAIRKLDEKSLKDCCGKHLTIYEIKAILKRRDAILALFNQLQTEKGDSALFP